jgi:hypothetical protein
MEETYAQPKNQPDVQNNEMAANRRQLSKQLPTKRFRYFSLPHALAYYQ